jgi:hypothetical protein
MRFPTFLLITALLSILAACAHGGRSEEELDRETSRDEDRTEETAGVEEVADLPPREIDRNRSVAVDGGAGTPQRRASQRVVEEGKGYLIARQPGAAAQRFSRATQIDPTNGFAYYWLGRARIAQGDARGAVGVLEKAESLLGPYPEWREQASDLLASLGAR